ncbi:MAG: hypothetical protein J6K43_09960 [Lachnospiraceae bacterium]|nr:hypothetical protein [Lachnospiraceae bacterium]
MENRIEDVIEELQVIADDFYQNKIKSGTEKMPNFVQKLSEIVPYLEEKQQQNILMILKNVMESMEAKNYIMLADILVFEVIDILEENQVDGG